MAGQLDVLAVADMAVDVVLDTDRRPAFGQAEVLIRDYVLEVGGSANIFASQFCKLGGRAGVMGKIGADVAGDFLLEKLRRIGVDVDRVTRDARVKTGMSAHISMPRDRGIMTYVGSIDALERDDLFALPLASFAHWHVASYFLLEKLRPHWPAWFDLLRREKKTISLDPNWDPSARWSGLRELLSHVDVFLPNESEAMATAGEHTLTAAGRTLSRTCPLVVVKRGRNGATAFHDGEPLDLDVRAASPAEVADATGAGDSFDAGFLRFWLLGKPIEKCLELGVRCGSMSLAALGGIEAQYEANVA
jgi:ribokinase